MSVSSTATVFEEVGETTVMTRASLAFATSASVLRVNLLRALPQSETGTHTREPWKHHARPSVASGRLAPSRRVVDPERARRYP
jgi:hypothetical protein